MQQRSADILVDTLRSEARAPSGYGTNLLYVYLLLAADGVLNALADTGTAPATQRAALPETSVGSLPEIPGRLAPRSDVPRGTS